MENYAIPAVGWYALYQGENDAIFLLPLCAFHRSDGKWEGVLPPLSGPPIGFNLTGYVRGRDIGNMRRENGSPITLTWDDMFDEMMRGVLGQQLRTQANVATDA